MGRLVVAVIVSSWVIPISILVNRIVPDPYMDEIFHAPQAQQYCKGNFRSWDPMITTPPGLYYLSLAHVACLFPGMFCTQAASSFSDSCSTAILRSTNAILAVICSVLVYEIITQLRPALHERIATLCAVVLALYPLHWFFTFLYYTDVASLTAVLAMYLACLKKNYLFSALLGFLAVFIRQTNIIWMLFVACTGLIDCTLARRKANVRLDDSDLSVTKDSKSTSEKGVTGGPHLRKRRLGNAVDTVDYSIQRSAPSTTCSSGFFDEIQDIFLMAWHLKWELLGSFFPFFVVLVAFVAFVSWNGSVVLGAKEAHAVSPHFAQIMYFSLVSALFMAPFHFTLRQAAVLVRSFWKNRLLSLFQWYMALTAGFLSVHFFRRKMANQSFCGLVWWRKWTKRDWAIAAAAAAAAAGFAILIVYLSHISDSRTKRSKNQPTQLLNPSAPAPTSPPTSVWVPLTLLHNANDRGAFCLDGSLPGYHLQKGFGSGSNNWVLHIEGGGWCDTIESCSSRKITALGSSRYMDSQVQFAGIFSHEPSQNPDFFNWNKVKIRYCDGASFAGNPESEFKNGTGLFFRGQLIWEALMDEFLSIGLSNARQALLSGCSAGGLATLLHCDDFREILPKDAIVKCLADAGFFLNEKDIAGHLTIESFYQNVVHLQGVAKSLDKDCVARMEPPKCFFPQEFIKNIKTPIFLVHPAYDFWQIENILAPDASDPDGNWFKCKRNIHNCNPSQIEVLQGYRNSLLKVLSEFQQNKEGGMFINSCFIHCQTWMVETWHSSNSPRINNKTIAESVGDWYFNRKVAKQIDCPYPCNPTCYNVDFTRG